MEQRAASRRTRKSLPSTVRVRGIPFSHFYRSLHNLNRDHVMRMTVGQSKTLYATLDDLHGDLVDSVDPARTVCRCRRRQSIPLSKEGTMPVKHLQRSGCTALASGVPPDAISGLMRAFG